MIPPKSLEIQIADVIDMDIDVWQDDHRQPIQEEFDSADFK